MKQPVAELSGGQATEQGTPITEIDTSREDAWL